MNDIEKAYRALAASIVLQAAKGYRHAVWKAMHRQDMKAAYVIKKLEKFFRSSWCFDLCDIDGERIIKTLRKECRYDSKRIPYAGK
jgi:hypothetical protein